MSWLEVALAFMSGAQVLFVFVGIFSGIGFMFALGMFFIEEIKVAKQLIAPTLISTVVFSFLACLPSVDDLWKVRIGLIKLSLASPENIQKGSETIERIAKKLECKYLECVEKEGGEK